MAQATHSTRETMGKMPLYHRCVALNSSQELLDPVLQFPTSSLVSTDIRMTESCELGQGSGPHVGGSCNYEHRKRHSTLTKMQPPSFPSTNLNKQARHIADMALHTVLYGGASPMAPAAHPQKRNQY